MTYSDFLALVGALSRDVRVEPNTPVELEAHAHVTEDDPGADVTASEPLASARVDDHPRRIVLSDR